MANFVTRVEAAMQAGLRFYREKSASHAHTQASGVHTHTSTDAPHTSAADDRPAEPCPPGAASDVTDWDVLDAVVRALESSLESAEPVVATLTPVTHMCVCVEPLMEVLHPRDAIMAATQYVRDARSAEAAHVCACVCACAARRQVASARPPKVPAIVHAVEALADAVEAQCRMQEQRAEDAAVRIAVAGMCMQTIACMREFADSSTVATAAWSCKDAIVRAILRVHDAGLSVCDADNLDPAGGVHLENPVALSIADAAAAVMLRVTGQAGAEASLWPSAERLAMCVYRRAAPVAETNELLRSVYAGPVDAGGPAHLPFVQFCRLLITLSSSPSAETLVPTGLPMMVSPTHLCTVCAIILLGSLQSAISTLSTSATVEVSMGDAGAPSTPHSPTASSRPESTVRASCRAMAWLRPPLELLKPGRLAFVCPPDSRLDPLGDEVEVNESWRADAEPPVELQLAQAIATFMVQCPHGGLRNLALGFFRAYLAAFLPACRMYMLALLLEDCPVPQLAGIMLDEVRTNAAMALRSGDATSPFVSRQLGRLLRHVVFRRVRDGLAAPSSTSGASAVYSRAQHIDMKSQADLALLATLRFVLLVARRELSPATSSIGGSASASAEPTASRSIARALSAAELREIRDLYVQPLLTMVSTCERQLREDVGIMSLHPHEHPFMPAIPAAHDRAAGPHDTNSHETHDHPAGAPQSDEQHALLSTLFILDAAIVPVVELIEAILPALERA